MKFATCLFKCAYPYFHFIESEVLIRNDGNIRSAVVDLPLAYILDLELTRDTHKPGAQQAL